jgi:uncharacterized membrane protein
MIGCLNSILMGSCLRPPSQGVLTGMAVALFSLACARAPWRTWLIGRPDRQHVWLGGLVVLLLLCTVRTDFMHGLFPELLFVTTFTLMHGWMLAIVGIGIVLAVNCLQQGDWTTWPAHFLCDAAVPALFIHWVHVIVARRLPRNFWVFIFVTVFAGTIAAVMLSSLARLVVAESRPRGPGAEDYLVVLGMMAFAEAYINGLLMAATVVYRPEWVTSFDDRLYFARGRRSNDD